MANDYLDVVKQEYDFVCTSINEFINEQFKVLNAGIIIFGALFGYGLKSEGQAYILAFVPFAMVGLMNYLLYRLQRNSILQGYRAYLEEKINGLISEHSDQTETIFYGSLARKYLMSRNILSGIQFAFYLIIYLASVIFGVKALDLEGSILGITLTAGKLKFYRFFFFFLPCFYTLWYFARIRPSVNFAEEYRLSSNRASSKVPQTQIRKQQEERD